MLAHMYNAYNSSVAGAGAGDGKTAMEGGEGFDRAPAPPPPIEVGEGESEEHKALNALHARLGTRPGQEHTWLGMEFLKVDARVQAYLMRTVFRPKMPHTWKMNPYEWMNNRDIHSVMCQYEDRVPDFAFIGVFPMDFAEILDDGKCVSLEMCALDLARLWFLGKRQIGIVFNTDKHYQSGSHWVAFYVNFDPHPSSNHFGSFYYDSAVNPVPAEIGRLHKQIHAQVARLFGPDTAKRFAFDYNRERRQFKNTECGVFAMLFIVCCISRRFTCDHVCKSMGRDEHVHQLREVFFWK